MDKIVLEFIDSFAPNFLKQSYFLIDNWQWLGLVVVILLSYVLSKIVEKVINTLLNRFFKVVKDNSNAKLIYALRPFVKLVFFLFAIQFIQLLNLNPSITDLVSKILYIFSSIIAVWFGHRLIELLTFYAIQKAQETETKFDDILIPLISKTVYVIIYILGIILIAKSFSINVSGVIAGLGIGGLAFAFAAKDTLANFFGSIMLVLDRPFDIGDVITAGDVEGVVTEVGFRSTRIRTFNDSVITISNGELMNRSIDNKGKRRFRRMVTTLGLEYGTPAEDIEAFCEGIRQLLIDHKWTRKDSFHVYFNSFGDFSLNIQMICYWETDDYAREQLEKHRLMIDILRLSKEIGVEFAFPTQTLHLFNETKAEKIKELNQEFRELGRQKAKSVAQKPITLKNPRSNALDEDQFGKNDL